MRGNIVQCGRTSLAIVLLAALGGCGGGAGSGEVIQLADGGPAVETVNGVPVPQKLLDAVAGTQLGSVQT